MISRDKGDQEREPRKKRENHDRNPKRLVTLPTLFSEPKTKENLFLRPEKTIARDFSRRSGSQKWCHDRRSAHLCVSKACQGTLHIAGLDFQNPKILLIFFSYSFYTAAMGRRAPRSRTTRRFSSGHLVEGSIGSILILSSVSAPSRVPQVVSWRVSKPHSLMKLWK